MFDPVMYDLDRYLDEEARREDYINAVDSIQVDLIKEGCEFYPYTGDAISEALGEATAEQWARIGKMTALGLSTELYLIIDAISRDYWYKQSEATAIKILERQMEDARNNYDRD